MKSITLDTFAAWHRWGKHLLVLCLVWTILGGCVSPAYYAHVSGHHLEVMAARRPVDELIASPKTPALLRNRLSLSQKIRAFASAELMLPDNGSYTTYADLERPALMWSVVAAPEFSLIPVSWDFLFAGRLSYRGFYTREKAERFAREQSAAGMDVTIANVPAYSTLGWFDDPLLSSFINWPEAELAALIFHELAHQQLYVNGDTEFNESFAEAVAETGVERWFAFKGDPEASQRYLEGKALYDRFTALLMETADDLRELYAAAPGDAEKRRGKAAAFARLREKFERLAEADPRFNRFEPWFARPLNNARLALVSTYHSLVPAFHDLLDRCSGELDCFYKKAAELEPLSPESRRRALTLPRKHSIQNH